MSGFTSSGLPRVSGVLQPRVQRGGACDALQGQLRWYRGARRFRKASILWALSHPIPSPCPQDGDDPLWTALMGFPQTNSQVNAYTDHPEYATTANGKLRLKSTHRKSRIEFQNSTHGWNRVERTFITSMIQVLGWALGLLLGGWGGGGRAQHKVCVPNMLSPFDRSHFPMRPCF